MPEHNGEGEQQTNDADQSRISIDLETLQAEPLPSLVAQRLQRSETYQRLREWATRTNTSVRWPLIEVPESTDSPADSPTSEVGETESSPTPMSEPTPTQPFPTLESLRAEASRRHMRLTDDERIALDGICDCHECRSTVDNLRERFSAPFVCDHCHTTTTEASRIFMRDGRATFACTDCAFLCRTCQRAHFNYDRSRTQLDVCSHCAQLTEPNTSPSVTWGITSRGFEAQYSTIVHALSPQAEAPPPDRQCAVCHAQIWGRGYLINGQRYCSCCAYRCAYCESYVTCEDFDTERGACRACAPSLVACEDCETHFRPHNTETCCQSCASERANNYLGAPIIGGYHDQRRRKITKPIDSPWTRANNNRMFGVELEVELPTDEDYDDDSPLRDYADDLLHHVHVGHTSRLCFCEIDGSLNNGFEIISQPMGLDRQTELWTSILTAPSLRDFRSHNTSTCGLHVHVNRSSITPLTLSKAIVAINSDNWNTLVKTVARRESNGYSLQKPNTFSKVGHTHAQDRYEMINTTNKATIEFRIFRGTLKLESLLAAIEFANAVLNWAAFTSAADLSAKSFVTWLGDRKNAKDTRNLRNMLARRRPALYSHLATKPNPEAPASSNSTLEESLTCV